MIWVKVGFFIVAPGIVRFRRVPGGPTGSARELHARLHTQQDFGARMRTRESFVLTNEIGQSYFGLMTLDEAVQTVQLTYPQVYYVCHTRHQRKRSTEHNLSARDAAILAHCSADTPIIPARLAKHLSIARSTLSEALKKLDSSGYVQRVAAIQDDGRLSGVLLTSKGLRAVRETSVLEADRLEAVLRGASATERAAIARGLTTLAAACRRYSERTAKNRPGGA